MSCKNMLRAAFAAALAASRGAFAVVQDTARIAAGECSKTIPTGSQTYFPAPKQVHADAMLAKLFTVTYAPTFKVLTDSLSKEQYVLTQCGQVQPSVAAVNAVEVLKTGYIRKYFGVPVQSSAAMSTVLLAFIDSLGVQDRVKFVDSYATAPCWQKALACDAKMETSYGNVTLHAEQLAGVDVVFMSCGSDCTNVNTQKNGVNVPVTQEAGPVESAEYIKYIAAFFNLEPKANELFAATQTSYAQASSGKSAMPPLVAWITYNAKSDWSAESFVVSQASYKTMMVTNVGATNLNASTALAGIAGLQVTDAVTGNPASGKTYTIPTNDDKDAAAKAFFKALEGVDVIVDEVYAPDPTTYNFTSFLSTYGLTSSSDLKFVKNKMVLRIDRTMGEAMKSLDWYESRIAKPEWAMEGLARVVYGDTSKRAKYFRNVAKDETVDQVLKAVGCTTALPVCSALINPVPIKTLGEVKVGGTEVAGAEALRVVPLVALAVAALWAAVV